jgi:hypothetical protein
MDGSAKGPVNPKAWSVSMDHRGIRSTCRACELLMPLAYPFGAPVATGCQAALGSRSQSSLT